MCDSYRRTSVQKFIGSPQDSPFDGLAPGDHLHPNIGSLEVLARSRSPNGKKLKDLLRARDVAAGWSEQLLLQINMIYSRRSARKTRSLLLTTCCWNISSVNPSRRRQSKTPQWRLQSIGHKRSRVVSRARVRPGSGFSPKCFRSISSLNANIFVTFRVTIFLNFVMYICCVHRSDFCEWSDCDFLQLYLFANTAAFFCSLLRLVTHFFEKMASVRKLARDGVALKKNESLQAIPFLLQ